MGTSYRFRRCAECGEESRYPTNKATCCLNKGQNRLNVPKKLVITEDELHKLVEDLVSKSLEAASASGEMVYDSSFVDGGTVLISDIHIPLHHVKATYAVLRFLEDQKKAGWLHRLVLAGDIFDASNLSRHPRISREEGHGLDFGQEIAAGADLISDMVDCIDGDCWYFTGNHEQRLWKKLAENPGIPGEPLGMSELLQFFKYPDKLQTFEGRKLLIGNGDEGTVQILHGEKYNKHRAAALLEENLYLNTVQGHCHRPQVYWYKGRFGMVNGYLHDVNRQVYDPNATWTLGFTIFDHWDHGRKVNPYFIRIAEDGSFSFHGKTYRG